MLNLLCTVQIHHDLAKYHEMGRFILPGSDDPVDLNAALFHEEHAAELGVKEAIVTLASIYLQRHHDVLASIAVDVSIGLCCVLQCRIV
jgi:elongation factor 2 kinase